MITATSSFDGPFLTLNASVSGPVVYLDNWAIGNLAEDDPSRRSRFINAMRSGGMELLFSVTNAAEISGPQGQSADAARTLLDEIGPHWLPVELDTTEVVKRELRGEDPNSVCISGSFLKSYLVHLMRDYAPGSGKVIGLSDDFFRLGGILDWVGPQRDSIRQSFYESDELLGNMMGAAVEKSKQDKLWLDKMFPRIQFNPSRRAHFVYSGLWRTLIREACPWRNGDAMDFHHAVMASAFASFATLDKHWKRRVASLPTPNRLARIYSAPDLDQMVTDMESWVARSNQTQTATGR